MPPRVARPFPRGTRGGCPPRPRSVADATAEGTFSARSPHAFYEQKLIFLPPKPVMPFVVPEKVCIFAASRTPGHILVWHPQRSRCQATMRPPWSSSAVAFRPMSAPCAVSLPSSARPPNGRWPCGRPSGASGPTPFGARRALAKPSGCRSCCAARRPSPSAPLP